MKKTFEKTSAPAAISIEDLIFQALQKIKELNPEALQDIAQVAKGSTARIARSETVELLRKNPVFGQSMYDPETGGIKQAYLNTVANMFEKAEENWALLGAPPLMYQPDPFEANLRV